MPNRAIIVDSKDQYGIIEYNEKPIAGGGEGVIYLSIDGLFVAKIFIPAINKSLDVLKWILKAHPPSGNEVEPYLAWPTAIVVDNTHTRALGVVMPNINRPTAWMLPLSWYRSKKTWMKTYTDHPERKGNFKGRVEAAICITAAARYLNRIGYAHADFSDKNVFVNPVAGKAALIDLDGLIVPNFIHGEVLGTSGYMAPELVTREQKLPDQYTDRHALAVVLYEFLLMGHPLRGGRPAMSDDSNQDDELMFGSHALYREHSTDHSNYPKVSYMSAKTLGQEMAALFRRSFESALAFQTQKGRPHPSEYESALKHLRDDLVACSNANCFWGYFPSQDGTLEKCPACGAKAPDVTRGYARILRANPAHGVFSFDSEKSVRLLRDCMLRADQLFERGKNKPSLSIKPTLSGTEWDIEIHDPNLTCVLISKTDGHIKTLTANHSARVSTHYWLRLTQTDGEKEAVLVQFGKKQLQGWS